MSRRRGRGQPVMKSVCGQKLDNSARGDRQHLLRDYDSIASVLSGFHGDVREFPVTVQLMYWHLSYCFPVSVSLRPFVLCVLYCRLYSGVLVVSGLEKNTSSDQSMRNLMLHSKTDKFIHPSVQPFHHSFWYSSFSFFPSFSPSHSSSPSSSLPKHLRYTYT